MVRPEYDYVGESLGTEIYTYLILIPFITVNDEERSFLENLSKTDEFKTAFIEAGNVVGYRLVPDLQKRSTTGIGRASDESTRPLYIYGSYNVFTEDNTLLSIHVYNSMTGRLTVDYKTHTTLFSLLNQAALISPCGRESPGIIFLSTRLLRIKYSLS